MQKNGFAADPNDLAHVLAYVAMRAWTQRVADCSFEHYIKNQVKDVGQGAKVRTMYWAVPKANFANGVPESLAQRAVDEAALQMMELTCGGHIDRETYHVIDQEVPREIWAIMLSLWRCLSAMVRLTAFLLES